MPVGRLKNDISFFWEVKYHYYRYELGGYDAVNIPVFVLYKILNTMDYLKVIGIGIRDIANQQPIRVLQRQSNDGRREVMIVNSFLLN